MKRPRPCLGRMIPWESRKSEMTHKRGEDILTQAQATNGVSSAEPPLSEDGEGQRSITKTLIWIGVAGISAALAFTVVRALTGRQPVDPTSQRIQQLIDEANQLLRTLDEQRNN